MKTSLKLVLSGLLVALTTAVSVAGDDPTTNRPLKKAFSAAMYPAADASKVWMMLEKTHPEFKVCVSLLDQKGHVLYHETLPAKGSKRNNGFSQLFDLSDVKDGDYTFRISTAGFQTEDFTFKLSTPTVKAQPSRLISIK